jgi:hypothetical protein
MPRGLLAAAYEAIAALVTPVATDPKRIKPGQLCRILNSTPLGHVLKDRTLRAHREAAGHRIGDDKSIDFLRYTAWLLLEARDLPPPATSADAGDDDEATAYLAKKERERKRNAALAASGRDLGDLPPPADPQRRAKAAKSFRTFCETYLADLFPLAWSDDHLAMLKRIETIVLDGGQLALAMPRGSGKTTILEAAIIWAASTGHCKFAMLIGASKTSADEMMDSIKATLETNDLLCDDFPEVCRPIRALEGIANRCAGQLHHGRRTHIGWSKSQIILAEISGPGPGVKGQQRARRKTPAPDPRTLTPSSGTIIRTAGITGRVRGAKYKRRDGGNQRPDLVLVDDPQTDASARSVGQCESREKVIGQAVLGLAGPGKDIAAFCACTVIRRGDLADVLLDRKKHPAWCGELKKLVYEFPANGKLWEEYAIRRADELANGGDGTLATQFYKDNRRAMDAGGQVAWPARFRPRELSALQHAMNLKIDDEAAFFAEYQNEPLPDRQEVDTLDFDALCLRGTKLPRGRVPLDCQRLTMFIDVQQKCLFWLVAGWTEDFGGHVVDYGAWPDQQRRYFTLADAKETLARKFKGAGLEGCLFAGLEACTQELFAREFVREDSTIMRVEKCLVDANWGASTETVYQWARQSGHAALILPSHGRYFGAKSTPFEHFPRRDGERRGLHWWLPPLAKKRAIRHCVIDTNWWKTFVAARLLTAVGDRGGLTLCGKSGAEQRLLCEHLTSETSVRTKRVGGPELDEWTLKPNRDNHFWDCLVGSAVAASMLGVTLSASQTPKKKPPPAAPRERVSYLF